MYQELKKNSNSSKVKRTEGKALQMKKKTQNFNHPTATIQRAVATVPTRETSNAVILEAYGKVEDFKDGEDAGSIGWNGVEMYRAEWDIADFEIIKTKVLDNEYLQAHAGHIVAKKNGGLGDPDNIFAQDGGVNTTGTWIQFENLARELLNDSDDNADAGFKMYLGGSNLTKGELDRDHMKAVEFSDSQKEIFGIEDE